MIATPYLTVDGIIELYGDDKKLRGIVLIERKNPPHGWALPGGFVDIGERVEEALIREMKEETSLNVSIESMLGIYSDPARDPRFHTVSIVYVCRAFGTPKAEDDAKAVHIISKEKLRRIPLVFDHKSIIQDYLEGKE